MRIDSVLVFAAILSTQVAQRVGVPALVLFVSIGMLATVGVVLKMSIIGGLAWLITPLDLTSGLLLGAVFAPTDAAAVFSVLIGCGLPQRLRSVLETESGTNDPVSIYLTMLLTSVITTGATDPWAPVGDVVLQLVAGGALGGDSAIPPPPRIAACATSLDLLQALQVVVPAGDDERAVWLQGYVEIGR